MRERPWRTSLSMLLAVAMALVVVTGCGSSSNSSSSSTSSSNASSSGVAQATAVVDKYSQAPTGVGVTQPLDKPPAKNRVVYYVECCGPSGAFMTDEAGKAAKALGWKFKSIPTKGTAESLQAGWEQAASDPNVSAVLGNGVPQALIAAQLKKLAAKKAVAVTWANIDPPKGAVIAVLNSKPFIQGVGDLMAAWMVSDSNGKANAAIFTVPSLPILPPLTDQFTASMSKYCPSCKSAVVPEPITALGTDMPSRIAGYLQRNPDVNYITAGWDDMLIGVPEALASSGQANKIRAIGYAPGSTANAGYVAAGKVERALIPYPYAETVWRAFDIVARHYNNQSITQSADAPLPIQILTKADIQDPGKLITITPDVQGQYEKLWGVGG